MKESIWRRVLVVLLALAMVGPLVFMPISAYAASTSKVSVSLKQNYKNAQTMLKLINKRRKKAGLKPVKLDQNLTKSAIQRAAEVGIYTPQGSPHRRPNGKLVRTLNSRISYEICSEATGYFSEAEIVKGWMNSPKHKAGILLKSAKSVGIACVVTGPGHRIWVCDFSNTKVKKVLKSTKQGVSFNKTVVAKTGYLGKRYFRIGTFADGWDANYTDLYVGYNNKLTAAFDGRYTYQVTSLNPRSFVWKSSNPTVATVSATGVVTPKKPGKVVITAIRKNNTSCKIKRTFTVHA